VTEATIPQTWSIAALRDLGEWRGGGTPSKVIDDYWNGNIPWVSPKDMKQDSIFDSEDHITERAVDNSATKLIPRDSILCVTRSGILAHTFPVAISMVPVTVNQDIKALTPFEGIDARYLAWALRAQGRKILETCSKDGTTVNSVESARLYAYRVPIAPQREQVQIVAKIEELFSELDNGIENLKTAKAQLLVYRQAVLKHALEGKLTARWRKENKHTLVTPDHLLTRIQRAREVGDLPQIDEHKTPVTNAKKNDKQGDKPANPTARKGALAIAPDELAKLPILPPEWTYVRLSEIAEIRSGMSVSKSRLLIDPITVPYLRVANVQRGNLDLSKITTMAIERDQLSRLKLKKWDVLFNEGGDRDKLGRGWIWESQIEPCITQNHVFRASPYLPSVVHAKFISHWGNMFGQNYFLDEGKQTTNLASINKSVLSNFPAPLASLEEQGEIVSEIDDKLSMSEQLERDVTTALERLQILKSAILDSAFSGTLVAQDPDVEPASVLLERIRGKKAETENGKKKIQRRAAA
jgi:type I restriction enzyme S subunit